MYRIPVKAVLVPTIRNAFFMVFLRHFIRMPK